MISPETRKLYDELGMEAVGLAWQVGPYTGGATERDRILAELERRAAGRLGVLRSRSTMKTGFDATVLFDDYSYTELSTVDYVPRLGELALGQRWETWLGPETQASLRASVAAARGTGDGTVSLGLGHQLDSTTRLDAALTAGQQSSLQLGAVRSLGKDRVVSGRLLGHLQHGFLVPFAQVGLSQALPLGLVGSVTLETGLLGTERAPTNIVLTLGRTTEQSQTESSLQLGSGPDGAGLGARLRTRYRLDATNDLLFKLVLGGPDGDLDNGGSVAVGLGRRWSDQYQSSTWLEVGQDSGVTLRLDLSQEDEDGFKLSVPVRLSETASPQAILVGAALPAALGFLFDRLVWRPLERRQRLRRAAEERTRQVALMEAQRQDAELAQEVLRAAYERRVEAERAHNGLVILEAVYSSEDASVGPVDVRMPLQLLAVDGILSVEGGRSKAGLVGFYDPAPGTKKSLQVSYLFRGLPHRTTVDDLDPLVIPQRPHRSTH